MKRFTLDERERVMLKVGFVFCNRQLINGTESFSVVFDETMCDVEDEDSSSCPEQDLSAVADDVDATLIFLTGESILNEIENPYRVDVGEIKAIKFVFEVSQGAINGRNGSAACALISLLVGYASLQSESISNETATANFAGCMEMGNQLAEDNHVTDCLNFEEALVLLPAVMGINFVIEENVLAGNCEQFAEILQANLNATTFGIVICNGKAYAVFKKLNTFFLTDSHARENGGAQILIFESLILLAKTFSESQNVTEELNIGFFNI